MKSTEKLQNEETKTKQRTIKLPQVWGGGKRKYKLFKNAIIAVASKAQVQMNSNSYTSNTKRARLGNPLRLTSVDYFDWF